MAHLYRLKLLILLSLASLSSGFSQQAPVLGDMDKDGVATVRDIAIIAGHFSGKTDLPEAQQQIADVNKDGAVNGADTDELVKEILGTRNPEALPLSTIRFSSPSNGEANVALTRETVVHFTVPLAPSASLDTTNFRAEFGGKKILSRVEISSDRKKATLFYLEPLPSNARIRGILDTTGLTDLINRPVDGDGNGVAGGTFPFYFDTLSITPLSNTAISGRVIASERGTGGVENPLPGVTVTVDGAEETLRAVTDAQGNFTLSPCPAGNFFVKIDGRTSPRSSWPAGDYYPFVGKKWHALAGRTDNLSGDEGDSTRGTIYLPCVCSGSLQSASTSQDTTIQFPAAILETNPELAGTRLIVPANSLFSDDGSRGGRVGIAPVAPDRLPSPLPEGLNPPFVITIQTDGGTNFDRPVPVLFPNTPDPVTGEPLPPGATSALWSFNHDTGQWEISGPMTVTPDGKFLQSDPGTGVRQPGWHVPNPGTGGTGGTEDPPDDPEEPLNISTGAADGEQPGQQGGQEEAPVMQEGDNLNIVANKPGVDWTVTAPPGSVTTSPSTGNIRIVAIGGSESIGDVVITGTYPGKDGPETDTIRITIVPKLQIAVDKNRDGVVSFGADDATSNSSPHVFWENSDSDNGGIQKVDDLKNGDLGYFRGDVDRAPGTINGLGDLEDFDRLILKGSKILPALLRNGYELRLVDGKNTVPTTRIGLSLMAQEDSTLGYLFTNPILAELQANKILTPTYDIASHAVEARNSRIHRFGADKITFLFEGQKAGTFSIKAELVKKGIPNTPATAFSNDVFLDIRSIDKFYDIYSPADTGTGLPETATCDNIETPYYRIGSTPRRVNSPLPPWNLRNNNEYLLFVHGWRMEPWERRFFAETAFKRMFWLGYRGRIGLFSWSTDYAPRWQLPLYQKNYDRSERRAYCSAEALRSLLVTLRSSHGNTCLLAHSMGNCVASEALRLSEAASEGEIAGSYFASQAATVANSYDRNVTKFFDDPAAIFLLEQLLRAKLVDLGIFESQSPDIYGSFPVPSSGEPYFSKIGRAVKNGKVLNFHNSKDDALGFWLYNQFTKPDTVDVDGDDAFQIWGGGFYGYNPESQRYYRQVNDNNGPVALNNFSDRYEIFSHIAGAQSSALGRYPAARGAISGAVDVADPRFGGLGGESDDHSGQFVRPLIRSQGYWNKIIEEAGFVKQPTASP